MDVETLGFISQSNGRNRGKKGRGKEKHKGNYKNEIYREKPLQINIFLIDSVILSTKIVITLWITFWSIYEIFIRVFVWLFSFIFPYFFSNNAGLWLAPSNNTYWFYLCTDIIDSAAVCAGVRPHRPSGQGTDPHPHHFTELRTQGRWQLQLQVSMTFECKKSVDSAGFWGGGGGQPRRASVGT